MKLQHQSKFISALVLVILLTLLTALIIPFNAFAISIDEKLLIIIDDASEKVIMDETSTKYVEIKHLSEVTDKDLNHIAYAVSSDIAKTEFVNDIIQYGFNNNARIYLYGNLTIAEFKSILDIATYSIQTNIYSCNNAVKQSATMYFSEEQEQNKVEQIISLSKDNRHQSLIVSAFEASLSTLEEIIIDHYVDTFVNPYSRTTLVQNSFNHRTYPKMKGSNQIFTTYYLNMDYYLYQFDNESISDYDYFAIRINITPSSTLEYTWDSLECTSFQVKLELPYSSDQIYEYGPYSSNKAKDINVSLGVSSSGVSGSIGFTFSPGSGPSVNTVYNANNRTIQWEVKKHWFFGAKLDNCLYPFGATWASKGKLAAIDVSTYTVVSRENTSDWNKIQVRYSY